MTDAAVVLYRRLVLVAIFAAALLVLVAACLQRMGAPRHLLGMVSEACMSLAHVSSETISAALFAVVAGTLIVGTVSFFATIRKTRGFVRSVEQDQRPHHRVERLAARVADSRGCIVIRDQRLLAFSHGLRRPRIYVSTAVIDSLDDDELSAVLAHEAHHAARRDPAKLVSARVIGRALFWLPVVNELRGRYELAAEVAADQQAIRRLGSNKPIARALLRFADAGPGVAVSHMAGGDVTWERIRLLASSEAVPCSVSRRAAALSAFATSVIIALTLVHLSLPGM